MVTMNVPRLIPPAGLAARRPFLHSPYIHAYVWKTREGGVQGKEGWVSLSLDLRLQYRYLRNEVGIW